MIVNETKGKPCVRAESLALKYGVAAETIRKWARRGVIPFLCGSAKPLLFDEDAVEEALKARASKPQTAK